MAEDPQRDSGLRRSPLQHMARQLAEGSSGEDGVVLEEIRISAAINLRGDCGDARFRQGVIEATRIEPPALPNTFTHGSACRCLWLGPDEWLLLSDAADPDRLEAALSATLAGQAVSVIDVGAGYAALGLSGPRAREVLAKACPLDFHPRAFRVGQCAQSVFARSHAIVALEDERPLFRLLVKRSFAAYLAEWLLDAMREYRC
jgi:sarcosine oxidase, subunit gamma